MNNGRSFETIRANNEPNKRFDSRQAFLGMPTSCRKEGQNNLAILEQRNTLKEIRKTALSVLGNTSRNLELAWARALRLAEAQIPGIDLNLDFLPIKVRYLLLLLLLFITSNAVLSACTTPPETNAPVVIAPTESPTEAPAEAPANTPTNTVDIDLSEVSGKITPSPTDAPPIEEPVDVSYPDSFSGWVEDDNSNDRGIIEGTPDNQGADPEGLKKMERSLLDQARIQGIAVAGTEVYASHHGYTVVIRDSSGVIWYAVQTSNNLPYPHLAPFGAQSRSEWKLVSDPLDNPNNTQKILESGNGVFFVEAEYDANGNPVQILDQRNGNQTKVENFKVSIERAKQIVPETVSINNEYGYNANGGVCAIFDPELADWIPIPFTEESISKLDPIQYEQASRKYFVKMIVWKVNRYGLPGNGAKEVRDANGNLLFLNALSVDAFSLVNGEWQVAEVPFILFKPDLLIFSDGRTGTKSFPENPATIDQIMNNLSQSMYYSAVSPDSQSLYDNPAEHDYYGPDANNLNMPEFGAGDVIELDFTKEGQIPPSTATQRLIEWMGLDPSHATDGLKFYLETGDTSTLAKNDRGIPKLFSTGVHVIFDLPNPE